MGTNGNGATAVAARVLPDEVEGFVLIGTLGFAAPSDRNSKQFLMDVEVQAPNGRRSIESASGWLVDQDGTTTPLGKLVMSGRIAGLVGKAVVVATSSRAALSKQGQPMIYTSIEGVWPLGGEAA